MNIHLELSISWWMIPTAVTVIAFLWLNYWPVKENGRWGGGITRMFMTIPALAVALVAWIIAAIFK